MVRRRIFPLDTTNPPGRPPRKRCWTPRLGSLECQANRADRRIRAKRAVAPCGAGARLQSPRQRSRPIAGRCRRGERSREPRFAGQYNLSLSLLPEYAVAGRVPKGGRNARSPRGHASGVFSGRRARQRDAGRAAALRGCRAAGARCAGGRNDRGECGLCRWRNPSR